MTNLIAKCQDATGNLAAAVLLQRIAYWMPKATREFGGHLWIAKSALDWCAETGLSFDQYRRAMALLKGPRLRLAVVERHKFGPQTITHVRLTEAGRQALGWAPRPTSTAPCTVSEAAHCPAGEAAHCSVSETAQCPNYNGDSSKEIPKGATTGVLAHANGQADQEKQISGENLKSKGISNLQSSPGILNQFFPENLKSDSENPKEGNTDVLPQQPGSVWDVQQKLAKKLHQPLKVSGLEAVWKQTLAEVQGGFIAAFTAKQRGQLKHFMQACPEGTAAAVLETVLREWVSFALEAEAAAGIKSSPDQPDVGFLLKHVGTAVNLHIEATEAASKKWQAKQPIKAGMDKPPVQSIAAPSKPDPDAEFDEATYVPASKAEVMALLGIETPADETPAGQEGGGDANEKL